MDVALIAVPYHLGHRSLGMGAGPDRLLAAGLGDALQRHGHEVEVERVSLDGPLAETAVELVARIADTASVKRADRVSA